MATVEQRRAAEGLLKGWRSDEEVARLTGVPLLDIIGLRADAAPAPCGSTDIEGSSPRSRPA